MKIPTKEIKIPKIVVYFIFGAILLVLLGFFVNSLTKEPEKLAFENIEIIQYEKPKQGQDIAIIETNLGTMKAMIFTDECPNNAELIKDAITRGSYTDLPVTSIEKNTLFIANTDREDAKVIKNEYHKNLWPLKGAICTNSIKHGYSAENLIFVDSIEFTDDMIESLKDSQELQPVADAFIEYGGIPNLSQQYTVIAQIYDGFDVLDNITAQEYDEDTGKPLEPVLIKKVTLSTYQSDDVETTETTTTD